MNKEDLENIGFIPIPNFNIGNGLTYDLGRNRHLSISCLGTPNEMLFICHTDKNDNKKVTDIICLSNFDYDRLLNLDKVKNIISALEFKLSELIAEQNKPLVECLQDIINKIENLSLQFRFNSNIDRAKEALKQFK